MENVDALPAADPSTQALLALQRAEATVVRADIAAPGERAVAIRRLRYLLGFARLTVFQPGAAFAGRRTDRPEVDLSPEVEPFRRRVLGELVTPLRAETTPQARLVVAHHALARLEPALRELRSQLLQRHRDHFTAAELDAECGHKHLALAAGGGGGAGWVYVGAARSMDAAGIQPSYVIGSSMGALFGLLRGRVARPDWGDYVALVHDLDRRKLFTSVRPKRKYGMPGLLALDLRSSIGHLFVDDGAQTRISDLPIPYEAVVAGVRRAAFDQLPRRFRATAASVMRRAAPLTRYSQRSLAPAIATRMWQVAAFMDPRVVKPIIMGGDDLTAQCHAVDAAGFSAAIPGVLHYDITEDNAHMDALLAELTDRENVSALVDGGVASNVPAEQAWRRVHAGKIGTRNVFVLAWDCFHPQWDPRHLWLQPITQAVALQQVRNAPFADWMLRLRPTLSPLDLVPAPERFDTTLAWGAASMEPILPMLSRLLDPVGWDDLHG